eukprot:gnl/Chilomastix_cuspidata/1643.p1 GENE.gnl/Chilomastix_cuspidata/1643~~gnl/Chilomastix_cuspidata/1643.p1  ORF type:complete len:576 (-),score=216.67 gnl/Chilomastix_cuspidata/1643:1029-2756(-)
MDTKDKNLKYFCKQTVVCLDLGIHYAGLSIKREAPDNKFTFELYNALGEESLTKSCSDIVFPNSEPKEFKNALFSQKARNFVVKKCNEDLQYFRAYMRDVYDPGLNDSKKAHALSGGTLALRTVIGAALYHLMRAAMARLAFAKPELYQNVSWVFPVSGPRCAARDAFLQACAAEAGAANKLGHVRLEVVERRRAGLLGTVHKIRAQLSTGVYQVVHWDGCHVSFEDVTVREEPRLPVPVPGVEHLVVQKLPADRFLDDMLKLLCLGPFQEDPLRLRLRLRLEAAFERLQAELRLRGSAQSELLSLCERRDFERLPVADIQQRFEEFNSEKGGNAVDCRMHGRFTGNIILSKQYIEGLFHPGAGDYEAVASRLRPRPGGGGAAVPYIVSGPDAPEFLALHRRYSQDITNPLFISANHGAVDMIGALLLAERRALTAVAPKTIGVCANVLWNDRKHTACEPCYVDPDTNVQYFQSAFHALIRRDTSISAGWCSDPFTFRLGKDSKGIYLYAADTCPAHAADADLVQVMDFSSTRTCRLYLRFAAALELVVEEYSADCTFIDSHVELLVPELQPVPK